MCRHISHNHHTQSLDSSPSAAGPGQEPLQPPSLAGAFGLNNIEAAVRAWSQAKLLLCWRPGAAQALQAQPDLLAQLLSSGSGNALERASAQGRTDVAAVLLTQSDGSTSQLVHCQAALCTSAYQRHVRMSELLSTHITAVHDAAASTRAAGSAMCAAAAVGHTAVVQQLVRAGGDVNHIGLPLSAAACYGHLNTIQTLLAAGADAHGRGLGCDALPCAVRNGHALSAEALLDAGSSIQELQANVLLAVAQHGDDNMLRLLLRRGLALGRDQEEALLRAAAAAGHDSIARLLAGRRVRTRAASRRLAELRSQGLGLGARV